jgi:hypothetical protein
MKAPAGKLMFLKERGSGELGCSVQEKLPILSDNNDILLRLLYLLVALWFQARN